MPKFNFAGLLLRLDAAALRFKIRALRRHEDSSLHELCGRVLQENYFDVYLKEPL